jgi:hypothetical protein
MFFNGNVESEIFLSSPIILEFIENLNNEDKNNLKGLIIDNRVNDIIVGYSIRSDDEDEDPNWKFIYINQIDYDEIMKIQRIEWRDKRINNLLD